MDNEVEEDHLPPLHAQMPPSVFLTTQGMAAIYETEGFFSSDHAGELRVISLRGRKLSTSRGNDLLIPYNFLLYKKTERHY
jgi:hypothetical protein